MICTGIVENHVERHACGKVCNAVGDHADASALMHVPHSVRYDQCVMMTCFGTREVRWIPPGILCEGDCFDIRVLTSLPWPQLLLIRHSRWTMQTPKTVALSDESLHLSVAAPVT